MFWEGLNLFVWISLSDKRWKGFESFGSFLKIEEIRLLQ